MPRKERADHVGEFKTAYLKNKKTILASQTVCGICGKPVDKTLKYPNAMSAVVDHIVPINKGGHPSDLSNLQLAHRWCNRQKSDKLLNVRQSILDSGEAKISNSDLPLHYDWKSFRAKFD